MDSTPNGKQLMGKRLTAFRERLGLSVVDLEKLTKRPDRPEGIRRSYIYRIEAGAANFSIDLFEELLKACKVTLAEFLTGIRAAELRKEEPDLYDMLDIIVEGRIPRQIDGIRVNLEAISLNVERLLREQPELRAQPPPRPPSRVKQEARGDPSQGGRTKLQAG